MPAMSTHIAVEDLRQAFEQARDLDGSMEERLNTFADAVRQQTPSSAAIVDRLVNRLRENGAGDAAPKPGEMMPPFLLPDENGRLVSLKELLEQGPAVVTFHRGHWCPYCRISINTLAKAQQRIEGLGARMVAIVPESGPFAAEMKFDSNVRFPILSDMDNGYALSLNLAIWVGDEMEEFMTKIGRKLPQYQGNDSWMLPIPATFVVGRDGRIKARFVDPDYRKRMAVEELIESLR
jgi:peroxiredoxin